MAENLCQLKKKGGSGGAGADFPSDTLLDFGYRGTATHAVTGGTTGNISNSGTNPRQFIFNSKSYSSVRLRTNNYVSGAFTVIKGNEIIKNESFNGTIDVSKDISGGDFCIFTTLQLASVTYFNFTFT